MLTVLWLALFIIYELQKVIRNHLEIHIVLYSLKLDFYILNICVVWLEINLRKTYGASWCYYYRTYIHVYGEVFI